MLQPEGTSCALQRGKLRGGYRREAHAIADGEKAFVFAIPAEHRYRSAADQPPTTGRVEWIDAGLIVGDPHAAGRGVLPRPVQTRRGQGFRQYAQIRKAGNESQKVDYVCNRRVQFHNLAWRHSVQAGEFVQIGAKFSAVASGNFHLPRYGQGDLIKASEIIAQNRFQFLVPELQRVKNDQNRAIGGMKVPNAPDRLRFEQAQQLPELLMSVERDLLAKVNQKRLIARGPELHFVRDRSWRFAAVYRR